MWHKPPVYGPLRVMSRTWLRAASLHTGMQLFAAVISSWTTFLLLKTYWLRRDPIDLDSAHSFKRPPLAAPIIIHQHCSYVFKRLRFNGFFTLDHIFTPFFRFMFNLSNLSWLLYSSAPGWLSVTSWENIDGF